MKPTAAPPTWPYPHRTVEQVDRAEAEERRAAQLRLAVPANDNALQGELKL